MHFIKNMFKELKNGIENLGHTIFKLQIKTVEMLLLD